MVFFLPGVRSKSLRFDDGRPARTVMESTNRHRSSGEISVESFPGRKRRVLPDAEGSQTPLANDDSRHRRGGNYRLGRISQGAPRMLKDRPESQAFADGPTYHGGVAFLSEEEAEISRFFDIFQGQLADPAGY